MIVKRTRKPLRSCASGGYRSSSIGGSTQCVPHVITFDLCVFFGYEREGAKLSKKARNPLAEENKIMRPSKKTTTQPIVCFFFVLSRVRVCSERIDFLRWLHPSDQGCCLLIWQRAERFLWTRRGVCVCCLTVVFIFWESLFSLKSTHVTPRIELFLTPSIDPAASAIDGVERN